MRKRTAALTTVVMMVVAMTGMTVRAQAYRPLVALSVTLPDGRTQDMSAPEGGLATVNVGGHEYGLRPTMMDDLGERIVIALFDMGGATDAVKELAEGETKAGGPVVTLKTTPTFKVKVLRVTKSTTTT